MSDVKSQLSRMKAMMNYGLKTEDNNKQYSSIEFSREGADGKLYGIIREGTKYYIKVSNTKKNPLKENFDYIGGFCNRKDYEYDSYAKALKQFDMKMISLKEATNNKSLVIESWNPDTREVIKVEATDKMKNEIARQRQIMANASLISEKKNYECKGASCCKVDKDCAATQKDNIKREDDGMGEAATQSAPFDKKVKGEQGAAQKTNVKKENKPVMGGKAAVKEQFDSMLNRMNEAEVLGWNDNADYMDKSHGTEVGDSDPFTQKDSAVDQEKEETVTEDVALHNTDNQNSPSVGTGEVGDDDPFTQKVNEDVEDTEDIDTEFEADIEDDGDEIEVDAEEDVTDDEDDLDTDDFESDGDELMDDEDEVEDSLDSSLEERISAMEELIKKIADKLDVGVYDDEPLYDDEESDDDAEDDSENADFDFEDDSDDEEVETEEDDEVFESKSYKRQMIESKLGDKIKSAAKKAVDGVKKGGKAYMDWCEKGMEAENPCYYPEMTDDIKKGVKKGVDKVKSALKGKKKVNEEETRLDDFGKHPAYQKEPVDVPTSKHQEMQDYYDMNDDSVESEQPFGEKIGKGDPFDIDPNKIANAIAESLTRLLGQKKN